MLNSSCKRHLDSASAPFGEVCLASGWHRPKGLALRALPSTSGPHPRTRMYEGGRFYSLLCVCLRSTHGRQCDVQWQFGFWRSLRRSLRRPYGAYSPGPGRRPDHVDPMRRGRAPLAREGGPGGGRRTTAIFLTFSTFSFVKVIFFSFEVFSLGVFLLTLSAWILSLRPCGRTLPSPIGSWSHRLRALLASGFMGSPTSASTERASE